MASSGATKRHKTSRWRLTSRQQAAIPLLVSGATDTSVAAAVGVSRETVGRWRANPRFTRALREAREQAFAISIVELRAAALDAVHALHAAVKDDDSVVRVRAAATILKLVLPPPTSATQLPAPKEDNEPLNIGEAKTRALAALQAFESYERRHAAGEVSAATVHKW